MINTDKLKHSNRRQKTYNLCQQRSQLLHSYIGDNPKPSHYYHKRKPFDCGITDCLKCARSQYRATVLTRDIHKAIMDDYNSLN